MIVLAPLYQTIKHAGCMLRLLSNTRATNCTTTPHSYFLYVMYISYIQYICTCTVHTPVYSISLHIENIKMFLV